MANTLRQHTLDTLQAAAFKALNRITDDDECMSVLEDAGFLIPDGQKDGERQGYKVFVRIVRFDEKLLNENQLTEGLLGAV